jgi:hypothetical protein
MTDRDVYLASKQFLEDNMTETTTTRTTIAASPGWYVAVYAPAEKREEDSFFFDAIVAWEIERTESLHRPHSKNANIYHKVIPVTTSGNYEQVADYWCLKTPDGKFTCVASYLNEDDALTYYREQHDLDEDIHALA